MEVGYRCLKLAAAAAAVCLAATCTGDGNDPPMLKAPFPRSTYITDSPGGLPCFNCHSMQAMTGTAGYHHFMNNDSAVAAQITAPLGGAGDTARNCLMCHVDHDLFSPDLNPLSQGRSHNLRVSAAVLPTSSPATLSDRDFDPAQAEGGLCLSCHGFQQNKAFVPATNGVKTLIIDRAAYTSAADTHNYEAVSYFSSDSSAFRANCIKCHDDGRNKIMQSGPNAFSSHDSLYASLLAPLLSDIGASDPPSASSPNCPEEDSCFNCHGQNSSYVPGPGPDCFGAAAAMPARALNMKALFIDPARQHRHPVLVYRNRHRSSEGNTANSVPDDLTSANRHVECMDCHNPHRARPGVHATPGNDAGAVLTGMWGVEPSYNPGNPSPASFSVLGQALKEHQVCFKCHSSYVDGFGARDKAAEFSPQNASYHPVVASGTNASMTQALLSPWTSTSVMTCSECHGSSDASGASARGPHASAYANILKKPYSSNVNAPQPAGDICFTCHSLYTYTRQGMQPPGYQGSWSNFRKSSDNLHISKSDHREVGCRACHLVHGSSRQRLIGIYNSSTNPDGKLTSFTQAAPGSYSEGNCSTRSGCH